MLTWKYLNSCQNYIFVIFTNIHSIFRAMFLAYFHNYAVSIRHESVCPFLILLIQRKWSENFIKVGHSCTCQFVNLQWSVKVNDNSRFKVWCKLQFIHNPALNFTTVTPTSQIRTVVLFILMMVRDRKVQTSDSMMFIPSFITFHYMVQKLWVDTRVW